jgi:universal stress protein G
MYKRILVPVDITDAELTKPAIAAALTMAKASGAEIRLVNVLPLTPVMLAEYVPPDFEVQQRKSTEEALEVMINELGLEPGRVTAIVRQGGVSHEVLEEAVANEADLICMSSHRPAMRNILLGSNASHVVRYAKCSVLVVRSPHQP